MDERGEMKIIKEKYQEEVEEEMRTKDCVIWKASGKCISELKS